ncbi:MAG: HD-GYP domain-containing protein [Treponema sp.]|nr:HD-GYP domain-containing protein [Treponema sp.]
MLKKLKISPEKIPQILVYLVLISLYLAAEEVSRFTSVSRDFFVVLGHRIPYAALPGVSSSLSVIILICLVFFYRKLGFYTSLVVLAFRFIKLSKGMMQFHLSSLPGIFITFIALVSVILIYQRSEKMYRAQEVHRKELKEFNNSIIDAFSVCIDGKDSYTNGHSLRVAKYTRMLAEKLGLEGEKVQMYYNVALLHDIGKIGIPDEILNKPGKLTEEEYELMKSHTERGYEILKKVKIQKDIADGAHYHHERYDGKGYPSRLFGEKIPRVARIISVAEAFDAMSSTRPYRKKLPMPDIVEEIRKCSGSQFDPVVAKAFLDLQEEGAFNDIMTE